MCAQHIFVWSYIQLYAVQSGFFVILREIRKSDKFARVTKKPVANKPDSTVILYSRYAACDRKRHFLFISSQARSIDSVPLHTYLFLQMSFSCCSFMTKLTTFDFNLSKLSLSVMEYTHIMASAHRNECSTEPVRSPFNKKDIHFYILVLHSGEKGALFRK